MVFRFTDVLKKIDGKWLIVHEHLSVPIDPVTGQADFLQALDRLPGAYANLNHPNVPGAGGFSALIGMGLDGRREFGPGIRRELRDRLHLETLKPGRV